MPQLNEMEYVRGLAQSVGHSEVSVNLPVEITSVQASGRTYPRYLPLSQLLCAIQIATGVLQLFVLLNVSR
jgi:hypothetical protein